MSRHSRPDRRHRGPSGAHPSKAPARPARPAPPQAPTHPVVEKLFSALQAARARGSQPDQASALLSLGAVRLKLGDPEQALADGSAALSMFERLGDQEKQGLLFELLASAHQKLGQHDEACRFIERGLAMHRQAGRKELICSHLSMLGTLQVEQQRPEAALPTLEEAVAMAREQGLTAVLGSTLIALSRAHLALSRLDPAIACLQEAIDRLGRAGQRGAEANARVHLALVYNGCGQSLLCLPLLEAALPALREMRDHRGLAVAQRELAPIYWRKEQYDRAIESRKEEWAAWQMVGDRPAALKALLALAEACDKLRAREEAQDHYADCLDLARELGDRTAQGLALAGLARTSEDIDLKLLAYSQAVTLLEDAGPSAG